jgi:hypothetical protein
MANQANASSCNLIPQDRIGNHRIDHQRDMARPILQIRACSSQTVIAAVITGVLEQCYCEPPSGSLSNSK